MKKNILFIILLSFISTLSIAQDAATDSTTVKEKDKPVKSTFESGYLIDAQTVVIPDVKTLEMAIQHKFATIENGRSNLWGIYGASNIRVGLNYVLFKNFQIGAGITKKFMTADFNAKWSILQQTRKNKMPVSVALYGNIAIDGRDISALPTTVAVASPVGAWNDIQYADRLSYFSQLIVARKFNKWFSLQGGVSFSHYNMVDYQKTGQAYDHDKISAHLSGRIKVSPQGSIIFNYDSPLRIQQISEQREWNNSYPHPKPNLAFGYEVNSI